MPPPCESVRKSRGLDVNALAPLRKMPAAAGRALSPACTPLDSSRLPALKNPLQAQPRLCGAVAQLGERVVRNDEVRGSIPLGSTISPSHHALTW